MILKFESAFHAAFTFVVICFLVPHPFWFTGGHSLGYLLDVGKFSVSISIFQATSTLLGSALLF